MPGSWDHNGTCFLSYFPYQDNEVVELGKIGPFSELSFPGTSISGITFLP